MLESVLGTIGGNPEFTSLRGYGLALFFFLRNVFVGLCLFFSVSAVADRPTRNESEIEGLVAAIRSGTEGERNRAVERLRYLQHPLGIRRLKELLQDPEDRVRARAAWALGIIGEKGIAPALEPLLEDLSEEVRLAAAQALGELRAGRAARRLGQCLNDANHHVRVSAARALVKIDDAQAFQLLLDHGLRSQDVEVRLVAATALSVRRDPKAVKILRDRLKQDPSSAVRLVIARGLAQQADKTAVQYLIKALTGDPDRAVRREAATALGSVKGRDSRRALEHALRDPDEEVRKKAHASLVKRGEWREGAPNEGRSDLQPPKESFPARPSHSVRQHE